MPRPKGKKVASRLSVGLSEPQHAALLVMAEENEATVAWLIRRAIGEFLEKHRSSSRPALRGDHAVRKQNRRISNG